MTKNFDVVVIGGGPGGYVAAIRAAQLGFQVACVDAWVNQKGGPALGGTCTNVGCIPSKALLQSSEHFEHANLHFAEHGIAVSGLQMDVEKMLARKNGVVQQNNDGVLYLFKKNKITFFHGLAAFVKVENAPSENDKNGGEHLLHQLTVSNSKGETTDLLCAKHVVIATGSNARALPQAPFDEELILSNEGALQLEATPKRLAVIGSGVIGLEMGSVWRRLGSDVTILEGSTAFLGTVDGQIAKEAHKAFTKQGLKIELGVQIGDIVKNKATKKSPASITVHYTTEKGEAFALEADRLVVSIGRTANTNGLNVQAVGLALDERGAIVVDADCKTNVPNVWAVGDVVRGPMLAHKAEEEAVAVAERIAGQHGHVDFNLIPWVIYTHPEIAWVGQTEEQLKASGRAYKAGTFPFLANGRARALGDTTGMVKMLADAQTDEILGVHIVGAVASELIAECVVAMAFKASSEDLARICHAHPSLSEATKEAALAVDKRTLNF